MRRHGWNDYRSDYVCGAEVEERVLKTAFRRKVKRHRSSLHELAGTLKHNPDAIETIPVVRINPALKRKAPIKVSMPRNKEDSKREDTHAKEEVKVYSDGSIHDGQVGAAAVMYRKGKHIRSLRLHLGPAEDHTIYEAELVGLLLAIHLIATEKWCRVPCAIGADNQATIKALHLKLTNQAGPTPGSRVSNPSK